MREFSITIEEPFQNGLRPDETFRTREGFLEECFNMVPNRFGLEEYELTEDPFDGGVTVNLPFPQVFRGRDLTLMFQATTLSAVTVSTDPWTVSGITTYDPAAPTSTKAITSSGAWHFIDLGPSFYAFNGACTVFRPGFHLFTGAATTTFVNSSVTIKTGCEYRGRVFLGGFDKANIWDTAWGDVFTEFKAEAGVDEITFDDDGPGPNWVMWSSIGGGDFPFWLMFPKGFSDLPLGLSKEAVLQKMKQNTFGWAPLRHAGNVVVMKPLGDAIIVYGDEGIEALIPQGTNVGFRRIANFGILGRGAVDSDGDSHLFLDAEGHLWRMGSDLGLERLGHREWLSSFSATSTAIVYSPVDRQFLISEPGQGYVLKDGRLAEHNQQVSTLIHKDGVPYGVGVTGASTNVRVMTGALDLRRQALKTLHDVQIDYSDITALKVEVLYRNDHTSSFKTVGAKLVGPEGVLTTMLTAREFKLRITGTPGNNPRITSVELRWNLVDKRAVRGQY